MPSLIAGGRTGALYRAAQGVANQPDLTNIGGDVGGAVGGAIGGSTVGGAGSTLGYGLGKTGSARMDWVTGSPLPLSAEGRSLSALSDASTSDAAHKAPRGQISALKA